MYVPPAFKEDDPAALFEMIEAARLGTLVTATASGLMATPIPLLLDRAEGLHGTLYGHLAKANPQWQAEVAGEALAIFTGPDAYITPAWYAAKREHGKVVPTWNYTAVHVYGKIEFFDDPARLHEHVSRLTHRHEGDRTEPWGVSDAPEPFIQSQLKGIVGLRFAISRVEGKRKLSQNRSAADRAEVAAGLAASERETDRAMAGMIRQGD